MPSVRYYNQTAPFWDFIASMEERGANHPFFADRRESAGPSAGAGPWAWGMPFGGHGSMPHHPPHHHRGGHHGPHGPHGPPPHGDHPRGPPENGEKDPFSGTDGEDDPEKTLKDGEKHEMADGSPNPRRDRCEGRRDRRERRRSCHGRRGGHGGFGGRGGWGGWRGFWGNGGPPMGGFDNFADFFGAQMRGTDGNNENPEAGQDFKPEADVFDTETAFIVDIPLPGAKREDVGVSWDAEKSELLVGGVVYREGDEDFIKKLAMDERKIGPFERKVRLGSRARPAQIDADAISAKLEHGVLRITVPKQDKDYVEIKKVDIE